MGELLDYEPSLPQKNEFFERRRMALGINSICTMFTPFRNEQRAFVHEIHEQRNFYEHREFVQKHELGYVRVETRKRNDIAISRATAGTNTNKLCPRERHLMTASNVWFQVTHTTHVLVSVGNGSWMLLSGTSMQDQGW